MTKKTTALRKAAAELQEARTALDEATAEERAVQRRRRAAVKKVDQRRKAFAEAAQAARDELSMTEIAEIAGLNRSHLYELIEKTLKS